jgi:hypothetical protein
MVRAIALACVLSTLGCRLNATQFRCTADDQCDGSALGPGRCQDGVCALPTSRTVCVSGFSFDRSAGALAGQCLPPADMAPVAGLPAAADLATAAPADMTPPADLTPPADMTPPADLAPACVPGSVCVPATPAGLAAVGACQGVLSCSPTASCDAQYSAEFQTAPAPNHSWDWSCDGAVEAQTPRGAGFTVGAPPANATTFCAQFTSSAACTADHSFALVDPGVTPGSCGETITTVQCNYGTFGNNFGCRPGATTTVVQACK